MLADDIAGRRYSKAERNRMLQAAIGRPLDRRRMKT